jgi:hypothetical protein
MENGELGDKERDVDPVPITIHFKVGDLNRCSAMF